MVELAEQHKLLNEIATMSQQISIKVRPAREVAPAKLEVIDDFLSHAECEHIIESAAPHMARALVSEEGVGKEIESRTGFSHWLVHDHDEIIKAVVTRIATAVGIAQPRAESLQVIHYKQGQEYRPHFDAYDLQSEVGKRCTARGGQRLVTALCYLNDVLEGGDTWFPKLKLNIGAKQGRIVIFRNCKDGLNECDPDTLHGGQAVIRGEKWACTLWFRERPY